MVTSRNTDMDELMSMNLGADGFITKPYNTKILLARMESLLKRSSLNDRSNTILNHGEIQLNLSNATILYKDKKEELTKNELNSVILTIKDNGIGICEKDIHRVFEKGFTGENGRLYGKSTGIGLYLCNNLANKLGLKLTLSSKKGLGTKVTISFPLDDKKIKFLK